VINSGYYNSRPDVDDTPTINNQQVVTFVSEGTRNNNPQQAMDDVTKQLTAHLGRLDRTYGSNPKVVSISHTSGYTDVTRFYATLIAVISV
jgi:hypothetical protein